MRLDLANRPKLSGSFSHLVLRHGWRLGFAVLAVALLTTRGATQGPVHLAQGRDLAVSSDGPTAVPCGPLPAGTTTWSAAHSPYILPVNTTNDPVANDPTACPAFPLAGEAEPSPLPGVVVQPGSTLVIDASQGPVQVFSHGAGIMINGGSLQTTGTAVGFDSNGKEIPTNYVTFDAENDVASWDGIAALASDPGHQGNISLALTSVAHALTSITINSGATTTANPSVVVNGAASTVVSIGSGAQVPVGLALLDVAIGPSYFDGIDVVNTPLSFVGEPDSGGTFADGLFGTMNNIGSQGISLIFNGSAPAGSAGVDIEHVAFGSSVPFGDTTCLPLSPCAAGTIGNDAVQAFFPPNPQVPVKLSGDRFYRAGSYGVELNGANGPVMTSNRFDCNGSGTPKPLITPCNGNGLKYSAIYLNNATVDLENRVTDNKGLEDGLDAIVFNGTVTSPTFTWRNATNDLNNEHALGYLINSTTSMNGGKFVVPDGSYVKVKDGAINLNGTVLDASGPGAKVFTSLRDNANIASCPSVFVQSCPSPLPPGEWGGIDLIGGQASGNLNNASILYATTGVRATNAKSLSVSGSAIGPTFADGITAQDTPVSVTGTTFGCPPNVCNGPANGDHGISADYTGAGGTLPGALSITGNNVFQGSVNEAIKGTALAGQPVDIEDNTIQNAGAFGINLQGADNLTLQRNSITNTGTSTPTHSAIYLNGISNADFSGPISANTGTGNGLNAIVFHGSTATGKPLTWQTVGAGSANLLGYMVDGQLAVNGDLNLTAGNDYAPILAGKVTVNGGTLTTSGNATFTSFKETNRIGTCGSVFVPRVSGACQIPSAADWGGLVLDPGKANSLTDSEIRYATTGISIGKASGPLTAENLTLIRTNVRNTSGDGIHSLSPISVTGGAFSNNAGSGIDVDLSTGGAIAGKPLMIVGHTAVSGSGGDGILATSLARQPTQVSDASVDHSGGYGIDLNAADNLTLTNNLVTNAAKNFAAVYLDGFTGPFADVTGNKGAGNGLDALVFHGTVTDNLSWQTARKTSDPSKLLGYLVNGDLIMPTPKTTLQVNAGDIVKVGGGTVQLQGVTLKADDTSSSAQKIFTSLADNSAGVVACPSQLLPGCVGPAKGDWGGISLTDPSANGALVNAAIRYATTGIAINSEATSTLGSSSFGLVISRSSITSSQADAIDSLNTAVSLTDSVIQDAVHGVSADMSGTPSNGFVRLSGNRFVSTSAEAILGQALAGQPVWITDNRIQNATTFGIRLANANELVLRNNNVSHSGAGSTAYSAIELTGVTGDFQNNIRGNIGQGNGINAIVLDGKVTGDLAWITPPNRAVAAIKSLGYMLDGGLTLEGGNLTLKASDVVKGLGGPITLSGGQLIASDPSGLKTFTSVKDPTGSFDSCPSFLALCGAEPGDWGGLALTDNASGQRGSGTIVNALINYANTGIAIDSGPSSTATPNLFVSGTTILNTSKDAINAFDSPIDVESSYIGDPSGLALLGIPRPNIGSHGIIASFFSPANCPASPPAPACIRLKLIGNSIAGTVKDGVVANGLGGEPVDVETNTVANAGTYGIRLVDANQLRLTDNAVNGSGGSGTAFRYPGIYLSNVTADFEVGSASGTVAGNHGLGNGIDAVALHGTATAPLTWLTTGVSYGTLPADHFGYILDGDLNVTGKLTTNSGDDVKALGGAINVSSLDASGTIFTSLKDQLVGLAVCDGGFDSPFVQRVLGSCPAAASGDWKGINVTGAATLTGTTIAFDDGLTVVGGALNFNAGAMHDIARNAIVANGSTISVTGVTFSKVGADGIDALSSAGRDTLADNDFDQIVGIAINLNAAPADLDRNNFTNDGTAVNSTGAAVTVQCSSVQSGGLAGDSFLTAEENDFAPGVGVTAPAGANVENNWWGQSTGPSALPNQLAGGVTVTKYFTSQNPTTTIAVTGEPSASQTLDPVKADGSLGTGLVQARLTFSRNMNTDPSEPALTYASAAVPFSGSWDPNNPRLWTGTAPIDALLAPNGSHIVSATGARDCVRDDAHNQMALTSQTFQSDTTGLPIVSVGAPVDIIGSSSARLHGHFDPNGWATGAGQFVVTNLAAPFDQHTYSTPILNDKTSTLDFTLKATGLQPSTTYGYTIQLEGVNGSAVSVTSNTFETTGLATQLAVTVEPPALRIAGTGFAMAVSAEDGTSQMVSDFVGSVSLGLTTPAGATLSGTVPQGFVNGVATFNDLSVDKTGTYTLTATSSPTLTSTTSSSFTIQPGAAHQLAFAVDPPAAGTAGSTLSPAVEVSIEDSFGNLTGDSTTQVTVALTSAGSATLSGTNTQTAASGVASFGDLSVDKTGSYTLTATSNPTLVSALSHSFTVEPGTASQLAFTVGPSDAHATAAIAPAVQVAIEDGLGNTTNDTSTITVSLASSNPVGGTLSGTLMKAAVAGVASFNDLSIDKIGAYTLSASGGGFVAPASSSFNITLGPASQLVFTTEPSSTATAGTPFAQQPVVSIEDAGGNLETGDSSTVVTLTIKKGTGDPTGTLTCAPSTNEQTAAGGKATFSGCTIDKQATGYQLHADGGGFVKDSDAFDVTP